MRRRARALACGAAGGGKVWLMRTSHRADLFRARTPRSLRAHLRCVGYFFKREIRHSRPYPLCQHQIKAVAEGLAFLFLSFRHQKVELKVFSLYLHVNTNFPGANCDFGGKRNAPVWETTCCRCYRYSRQFMPLINIKVFQMQ